MHTFGFLSFALLLSACGAPQSAICRTYVACQQQYDGASQTGPVDVAQYQADGICWQSAANAAQCDADCTQGVTAIRQAATDANLDVPACRQ